MNVNDNSNQTNKPPSYNEIVTNETTNDKSKEEDIKGPSFVYKFENPPTINEQIPTQLPTLDVINESNQTTNQRSRFSLSNISTLRFFVVNRDQRGTNFSFVIGFLAGFILNWFGLLISFCLGNTLALRAGAISGFGLFVIRWSIFSQLQYPHNVNKDIAHVGTFMIIIIIGGFLFVYGMASFLKTRNQNVQAQTDFSTNNHVDNSPPAYERV